MIRLYDTASRDVQLLSPRDPGVVAMYVCGPTVYGPPHVGHGRGTLVYDVLRRYLEFSGFTVRHVVNVTDVDDKIIARSIDERVPWQEIVDVAESQWWTAMDWLGALRPSEVPHATQYIEDMVALIEDLVARGAAYETTDGVYLATSSVPDYGMLAHQRPESLLAGARIEVVEEKRSPSDFVLWKAAKPGEPRWDSPFGPGRPGWHTECVVMSIGLLGEGFDVHGGGLDLVFPHHENERAQAVASGRVFSRRWVHNGLVNVGGEKMSKSLGNVLDIADLAERADPRAFRLLVLRARYRSPLEVGPDAIDDAVQALGRIDALARRFRDARADIAVPPSGVADRFVEKMDDDLDTSGALAVLFDALREANALADRGDGLGGAALARSVLDLFAVLGLGSGSGSGELDAEAEALRDRYEAARSAADYASSDALRAELMSLGWRVEDTADGTRLYR